MITITCRIEDSDGAVVTLPKVTARVGQKVKAQISKDIIYPVEYDLPEVHEAASENSGIFPVTPTTPTSFAAKEVGDFLTVTSKIRGSLVELSGTLTSRSSDLSNAAVGEVYTPITDTETGVVLTSNRTVAPEFKQIESTIRLCGRPGVEYKIHLNAQERDVYIKIDTVD